MAFNWQQRGWPGAKADKAALADELRAFRAAFLDAKAALRAPQDPKAVMAALVDEAMTTSAIEGIRVDESVVMSSICKALGMKDVPLGFARDARAEGVAQMVLAVRADWDRPICERLIKEWHAALMANDPRGIAVGEFRAHAEPMRVVRRDAYGEMEVRFEAPPSRMVPMEMARFAEMWKWRATEPDDVALKCAMLHPHFESIHPFEDGNGRVGRALVAKTLAEGLGQPLVLPVSTVIEKCRKDYYEAIHGASQSLDWTEWAKFFIPVLSQTLTSFLAAARFVAAKAEFLSAYESRLSERARAVVLRMFRDGPAGVAAGLSVAKWMRMTKVSKSTAERDIADLVRTGAAVAVGDGSQTRYRLVFGDGESSLQSFGELLPMAMHGTMRDPINDPIKRRILDCIAARPGVNRADLAERTGRSVATVKRAVAALVAAGKIEHRGSKKTGGYYAKEAE